MDTNNYKSVSIDIETYEILAKIASHECRTVGGQIRWLIKQMPLLADLKPMSPSAPLRRKKKATAPRMSTSSKENYTSKILSTLCHRGDLERTGTSGRPYYYHITPRGIRSHNAVMARRAA